MVRNPGYKRRCDYGRTASYNAEREVFPHAQQPQLTDDELREWTRTIHEQFGPDNERTRPIKVEIGRLGGAWAQYLTRTIRYGGMRCPMTVCHELAHIYSPRDTGHGPEWRRQYVRLVSLAIGQKEGDALAEAFARHGVPIDATSTTFVRKKETKPRRQFVVECRTAQQTSRTVDGGLTCTYYGEPGPWRETTAKEWNLTASECNYLRDGGSCYRRRNSEKIEIVFRRTK